MNSLNELHKQIISEINEEREKEMADFVATKRAVNKAAAKKVAQAMKVLKAMGVDLQKLRASQTEVDANNDEELEQIKKKYADESSATNRSPAGHFNEPDLTAAVAPEGSRLLPPSYAAVFSSKNDEDKLSGGT